jgi:altronate dehydratase small subunit
MEQGYILINKGDNVVTLLRDFEKGERINVSELGIEFTLLDNVEFGHKVAIRVIRNGEKVIKYGESIGSSTKEILPGEHVHIQNTVSDRGRGDQ